MLVHYKDPVFGKGMEKVCGYGHALLQKEADRVEGICCNDRNETIIFYRTPMNTLDVRTINGQPDKLFDLGAFRNLRFLEIYYNSLKTENLYLHKVSPMLESLSLIKSTEAALAELGRFPNLKYLQVMDMDGGNGVTLAPIPCEIRQKIKTLQVYNLRSMGELKDCCNLEELDIFRTADMSNEWQNELHLEKLKALKVRYMPLNIGTGDPFPRLQHLDAADSPGVWTRDLMKLKNLQSVNLSGCEIYDVSILKGLPLKYLDLRDNMIEDIAPICQNESMEFLSLGSNPLTDITPLEALKNLHVLHLDDTWVEDISPLMKLDKLEEVSLPNTMPQYNEQIEALKRNNRHMIVR